MQLVKSLTVLGHGSEKFVGSFRCLQECLERSHLGADGLSHHKPGSVGSHRPEGIERKLCLTSSVSDNMNSTSIGISCLHRQYSYREQRKQSAICALSSISARPTWKMIRNWSNFFLLDPLSKQAPHVSSRAQTSLIRKKSSAESSGDERPGMGRPSTKTEVCI